MSWIEKLFFWRKKPSEVKTLSWGRLRTAAEDLPHKAETGQAMARCDGIEKGLQQTGDLLARTHSAARGVHRQAGDCRRSLGAALGRANHWVSVESRLVLGSEKKRERLLRRAMWARRKQEAQVWLRSRASAAGLAWDRLRAMRRR